MSSSFDTIVVGGGGMGSACAYYLASAGRSTLVIERFRTGHDRGSSHGESRIIRYSYEFPSYVRLAKHNYGLWADLEVEAGEKFIRKTGDLSLGEPDNPLIVDTAASLKSEGVEHELLDGPEILKRYPQFKIGAKTVGIWQPDGGILSPEHCVPCLAGLAVKKGAQVVEDSPVKAIKPESELVTVSTDSATYRASNVVVTAGAWTGELLAGLGLNLPLKVTQEQYAYFKAPDLSAFTSAKFPVFLNFGKPGSTLHYGFPVFKIQAVKMALHHAGRETTANTRSNVPDDEKLELLKNRGQELLPCLGTEIITSETCLYTTTPDTHFVIGKLPGDERITVGAGFSGHGFKFLPVVGKILAELSIEGETQYAIDTFRPTRFAS